MKKIALPLLVFSVVTSDASMADEKPWENSFSSEKGSLRYQHGSLEAECSDGAGYAKFLSAAIDNLIRIQDLNVTEIKADDSMLSVDPNADPADITIYDDSGYLNGSVLGRDVPSEARKTLIEDVRRHTTLTALKYKADYEKKSFGDEFPDSVQREVWDFCMSQGEAMLRNYQN
jgi:hypothetical protein